LPCLALKLAKGKEVIKIEKKEEYSFDITKAD